MKKNYSGVAAKVQPVIEGAVTGLGCKIWDIEFLREGADYILRITIDTDREGGIGIDDCEAVHRAIDPLLDEADPIESSYYLQVSSPGVERDLTMPWHIAACEGQKAEARLFSPLNGKKVYTGILNGTDEAGAVLLSDGDTETAIPAESISRLHLVYDFGD